MERPPTMASAEGEAAMGLLPRVTKVAVLVISLVALISLPSVRVDIDRAWISGSVFTPSIAWAGGSPDETLKPSDTPTPPTPTPKTTAARITLDADVNGTRTMTYAKLTTLQRWHIFVSVFRTFALRF